MSMKDKGHPTTKRLAAVSFLNSISLNGSYKDSCWPGEGTSAERMGDVPDSSFNRVETFLERRSLAGEDVRIHSFDKQHQRGVINGEPRNSARTRSNTGSFCRPSQCSDGISIHQKHAHFSSSESLDHDLSVNRQNTTIFNLKRDPLPPIKNERLVILVSHRSPLVVFSALPYSRDHRPSRTVDRPEMVRRTRNTSGSRPISTLSDPDPLELLVNCQEEEVSYGYLLQPAKAFHRAEHIVSVPGGSDEDQGKHSLVSRCTSYEPGGGNLDSILPADTEGMEQRPLSMGGFGGSSASHNKSIPVYSPHMLDDPEFRAGKHRTLLTFPSYITSVIDYCKASDMKKELNDKFKDRFPHIHLTLSKLRSLKREMRRVAKAECNIDLLSVAQAYVYFEKLILGSFVTKYNRKFCAGACLLLSAKLNDVKGYYLHNLLEMIERTFRVNRKDLLSFEFAVLIALEFTLHIPTWEVFPHYQRLLYES